MNDLILPGSRGARGADLAGEDSQLGLFFFFFWLPEHREIHNGLMMQTRQGRLLRGFGGKDSWPDSGGWAGVQGYKNILLGRESAPVCAGDNRQAGTASVCSPAH